MMILCKVTRAKRIGLSLFVVLGLFLVPAVSYAHLVELLSSNPENGAILAESPGTITAVFNEEVGSESSTLQVFDADGNQVDAGNGGVDLNDPEHLSMQVDVPALAQGAYTVRWFVMLLDGDGTSGSFNFFVGDEAAANAANFIPIPDGSEVSATAAPGAAPSNTIWLIAGIVVSALFVGGAFFFFARRSNAV